MLILFNHLQRGLHVTVSEDIEITSDHLFSVLIALASQRHLVETILLREALLSSHDIDLLFNIVALLLVFVPDILLIEALLIFYLHIDRVIHQTITIKGN